MNDNDVLVSSETLHFIRGTVNMVSGDNLTELCGPVGVIFYPFYDEACGSPWLPYKTCDMGYEHKGACASMTKLPHEE